MLHHEIPDHHTQIEDYSCNIGSISLGQHCVVDKCTPLISCWTWRPSYHGGINTRLWDNIAAALDQKTTTPLPNKIYKLILKTEREREKRDI